MKNCIMLWKNDAVDLAINNQRRAFSDAYNNEVLAETKIYIELSSSTAICERLSCPHRLVYKGYAMPYREPA